METEAYEQKLKAIQAYLPILEKHIYRNVDGKKEAPIDVKLKTLHAMITSKDKKLGASTLDNCLAVLVKVFNLKLNPALTKIKTEPSGSPRSPLTVSCESRKSPIIIPTERKDDSSKGEELYRRRSPSRYDREFKKEKRSPTRFDRDFKIERMDEYTRGTGGYIKKEPKSSRDYDYKASRDYEHHKSSKDYYDSRSSKDQKKTTDKSSSSKDDHKSKKDDRKNDKHKKPKSPKGSKTSEKSNGIQTDEDLKKSKLSVFDRLGPLKVETKTTLSTVEPIPIEPIEDTPVIPIDDIEELLNERLETPAEKASKSKKTIDVMNIPPLSADDIEGLLNESPTNSTHKELDKKELDELKDLQDQILSEIKADKIDLSSILLAKPSASKNEAVVPVPVQPERLALKFNPHPRKKAIETNTSDVNLLTPILLPPITLPPLPFLVPQPVPSPFTAAPVVPIKETRTTLITDPRLRSEPILSYKSDTRFTSTPTLTRFGSTDAYPMPYRNTQLLSSFQNEQNGFIPRGNPIEVIGDSSFNRNVPNLPYNNRQEQNSNFNNSSYSNESHYNNPPSIASLHIGNSQSDSDAYKNNFTAKLNDTVEREKYERSKKNKNTGEGNNIEVPIQKSIASTSPKSKFDNTYRHGDYSTSNDVASFKIPRKRNDDKNAGNSNEKEDELKKCDSEKVKNSPPISLSKINKNVSSETDEKDVLKLFEEELAQDDDVQLIEEPVEAPIVIDDDDIDSKEGILKLTPTPKSNESEITKEWLETRLSSLLNPTVLGKENLLNMMSKVIDEKKMAEIMKILDGPDKVATDAPDDVDDDDDDDDLPIVPCKTKKVKPLKSDTENESEEEIETEVDTPVKRRATRSTTAGGKKRVKKKNELQKLNEDIRTMFISEGVLTATGRRMCTIINESNGTPETTISTTKKATTPIADEETNESSSTTTKKVTKKKVPVQTNNHSSKKATTPIADEETPEPSKKIVKKKVSVNSSSKKATTPVQETNPDEATAAKKIVKNKTPVKTNESETPIVVTKRKFKKKKVLSKAIVDDEDEAVVKDKTPEKPPTPTITLPKTCHIRLDKIVDPKSLEPPTLVEAKIQPPQPAPKKRKSDSSEGSTGNTKNKKKRSLSWSSGHIRKQKKKKKTTEEIIPKKEMEIPLAIKEEEETTVTKSKKSNSAFLPPAEETPLTSIESIGLPERRVSISIADKLNEKFNSVNTTEEDTVRIVNVPISENDLDNPIEPVIDSDCNSTETFAFRSVCKGEIDTQSPLQKKAIAKITALDTENSLSSDVNVTGANDDDDDDDDDDDGDEWEDMESDSENAEIENSLPDDIPKTGKDASNFQTLQRLFDNIQSDKVKQQMTVNETSPKSVIKLNIKQSPQTPTNLKLITNTETKLTPPTVQKVRVVSRVQNLGFVKEDADNTYICCIEACNFITKDSEVLFTHIGNHTISWEGYCHICEAHVLNDEKIPLKTEYRHMMEVHVKLKSLITEIPVNNFQSKGIIKLRRLSGDKLSGSTNVVSPAIFPSVMAEPSTTSTVGIDIIEPEPFIISKQLNEPVVASPIIIAPVPTGIVRYGLPASITVRKTIPGSVTSKNISILKKLSPQQMQSFGARKSTTQITKKPPVILNQKIHQIISHKKQDSGFNIVSVQTVGKDVQLPTPEDLVMKITSVMGGVTIPQSDSSNDSIKFTDVPDSNTIALRPWIKADSLKYDLSAREMLRSENRFLLYKCMEKMCTLMTNDRDLFLKHIRKHEQDGEDQLGLNQTSMDMDSWLTCSYCDDVADSCSSLVVHIDEEHSTSIFQCTHCFYRSSTAYNVITHHTLHHKNKGIFINISNGASMMLKAEMGSMIQYRKENVRPIICQKECGEFFILQEFEDHLNKNHPLPDYHCKFCPVVIAKNLAVKHLVCHSIGLFACIFCHYGTNSIQSIRSHMSNDHSSKLLYVCVRFLRNDIDEVDSSSVDSTVLVHLGDTVPKTVFTNYNITTSKPAISQSISSTQTAEDTSCCHILSLLELQKVYLDNGGNTEINDGLLNALAPPPLIAKVKQTRTRRVAPGQKFEKLVEELNIPMEIPSKPMPVRRQSVFLQELPQSRVMPARRKSVYVPAEIVETNEALRNIPNRRKSIYVPSPTQEVFISEKLLPPALVKSQLPRQQEIDEVVLEIVKKTGLDGEELYCCCFCGERSIDHRIFSIHMLKYKGKKVNCVHCEFKTDRTTDLLIHLKRHQRKRYFCYLCDEKCTTLDSMILHFEKIHTKNYKIIPINPDKVNKDCDIFIVTPSIKNEQDIYNYGLNLIEQKRLLLCGDKKIFQPYEFDDLPRSSIFESEVFCAVCSYHTKVRMNMIQHLKRHFESKPVASVDPVNPVPCLNQSEKHFDRMNNLACSSQENITRSHNFTNSPKFVVDFHRYICGAKGCVYQTVNATTLKNHLQTLHNKERGYKCPHCTLNLLTDIVSADKVITHLKLHDTNLFKCSDCDYYSHLKVTIDRHISERKHLTGATCLIVRDQKTLNFKPAVPIDNTPLWIKNQLSNVQKNIRGILIDDEEEQITLHYSDDDEIVVPPITIPIPSSPPPPSASTSLAIVKPLQETLNTNPHVSFICYHCIKRCSTIDELKQHWNQMHKLPKTTSSNITYPGRPFLFKIVKILSCFHCKTSGKFSEIKQHSLRCHPNQTLMCVSISNNKQCGQCDFLFNTEKELEEHYEKEHFKNNINSDKDAAFFMNQEFLDELLNINNCIKYKCEYCDLVIDDKIEMKVHCTEIHPINQICIKEASSEIQYACSMCKDIFNEEFEAIRHIRNHGPTYKCNYCEKNFKSTKMLRTHHEIIHNKSDSSFRTQDLTDQMDNYLNMKVIFPNGLILLKNDLAKTNYGNFDEIMSKIEHWNQQDKQEKSDKKTALHLHTTLNRNAPGPASKKRLSDSVNSSPTTTKRMKHSNNKRIRSNSSSGDEYRPDGQSLLKRRNDNGGNSNDGSKSSRRNSNSTEVEYSFYGQERESVDITKLYTNVNIGGIFFKISVDKFASDVDINPFISIPKIKDEK